MDETRSPIASVEEVREQLRRLGYLDSGLDRFVLGGAGTHSPWRASSRVAVRVGAMAGPLLGAAFALAAASLDRRLLAEPRDLFVLATYLALLTGALVAAGAFLLGLLAAWAARRGGRPGPALPRNVGLVLAVAGFGYLALWWRSHAASAPLLAQGAALVFGLGLALLLARFGSLAAVAALSAGGATLPEARLSRRHLAGFLSGAAVLLSAALAVSVTGERAAERTPDFAVVPTGLRVRVLGIDGLEARMADQLLARGEMPSLQALLARGARARLEAEPERVPAIVWTTVATGRGPEAHGIQAAGARRLAGMRTPVSLGSGEGPLGRLGAATDLLRLTRTEPPSSVLRSVKTFWNVASDKGLRVGVVNWWATWPCESLDGYVVTDRTFFRVERGGATDREACPPEVFERLVDLRPAVADRARALDLFYSEAARRLRAVAPPDVEAVYLPGLDIATMQLLGEAPAADLASLDQRLEAVRAHYRFVDERIGEVSRELGPGDVLLLVADPGRLARQGGGRAAGLLVMAGGPVTLGDMGSASERDVAPTALHLLGLPVSRELDGRVLVSGLRPEWSEAHPVRYVEAYGRRPPLRAEQSDFDAQVVEELRSLGYIQ
ncbi:MAG TPA: alkaline phosphatase family protein [Vicinamibacteria bacterium]|nr:alkaline phosphatase family protein [Vicinamibacteria bacterium]